VPQILAPPKEHNPGYHLSRSNVSAIIGMSSNSTSLAADLQGVTYAVGGEKSYELSNHLGNVLSVISDRREAGSCTDSLVDFYYADGKSVSDYYPFGMAMDARTQSAGGYRWGFNGQEKDEEVAGSGNSYTAEFWQYDSRLGRRWNVDPVIAPWESPYATFRNNPIFLSDPNGDCSDCDNNIEPSLHTVKKGETLTGIAKQTGTTVENLSEWNNIEEPNKIYAGSSLFTSDPNVIGSSSGGSKNDLGATIAPQANEDQSDKPYFNLASLGLTVVGIGAEATLMVNDYAKLQAVLKEGSFIMDYNGSERIWKMGFRGNHVVSSSSVSLGKRAFTLRTSSLKVVKGLGITAAVCGGGISLIQYSQGEIGGGKLTVDMVMTGVAFIPGVGWIASGAYFMVDGIVGWENGMQSYERLDVEHRRATGRGILQGPKW